MEKINLINLPPIARTLFVPLACRARESARSDAMICDSRAVELFTLLEGGSDLLMGLRSLDQTFTVMRIRQFDNFARAFLYSNPQGLVVDIGCGLDTRPGRIDIDGTTWVGLDIPEVIELRRRFLPDSGRCRTIACSMLDLSWLDNIAKMKKPVIFLAEGVFPYFTEAEIEDMVTALADRLSGSELAFDALSSFSIRLHNFIHPVLKQTGSRLKWGVDNPFELETWGMRLLIKGGTSITMNPA